MEELELFKKKVEAQFIKASNGSVGLLSFIDDSKRDVISSVAKIYRDVNVSYYGGILDADYNRVVFSTYDIEKEDFKIVVYKIVYNSKYYEVSHRSILGSLMALGIKRDCIGDIVINDSGAYFACTKEISKFILEEFNAVGKAPIELLEIDAEITNERKYTSKLHFVSSLRLDGILASGYNISRSEAHEMIVDGLIRVNHRLCQNPSHLLTEGDMLSVTKKGRLILDEIGGNSKSGRIIVTLKKQI
jgi:RNA-binding protein YlmH